MKDISLKVEVESGATLSNVAASAIELSTKLGIPVRFTFQYSVDFIVNSKSTIQEVQKRWTKKMGQMPNGSCRYCQRVIIGEPVIWEGERDIEVPEVGPVATHVIYEYCSIECKNQDLL